ncbi:MAG: hypothetical protein IPK97_05070 [Ahniella sp.]|nr:hypothetical protein [Ahniella sp.]
MFRRLFARILFWLSILLLATLVAGGLLANRPDSSQAFDGAAADRLIHQAVTAGGLAQMDPQRRSPAWARWESLELAFSDLAPAVDMAPNDPLALRVKAELDKALNNPFLIRLERREKLRVWLAVGVEPNVWVGQNLIIEPPAEGRFEGRLIGFGIILLIVVGAYLVARELAAPIERLARQAENLVRGRADPDLLRGAPSEIRELATSLMQAGASRTNALRERELILAGLSHDLRTPLSRIRLALELGDAHTDEGRGAMAADIEEIDAIVRQFIDYVRSGREESPKEIELAPLVQDVVQANGGNMKNWTIKINATPRITVTPLALQRALANLIVNARRHAAPPYTATLVSPDADHVAITITDEGTGIPLELHRRIGEPFLTRESRTRTGSGLGLAIVSRIIRRHGGRLELLARQPRGTMARIILPLKAGALKLDEV